MFVKSIIVVGPQACGKSRNADRIRKHFRLKEVLDGWSPRQHLPKYNTLILSNERPSSHCDLLVIDFAALKARGVAI